MCVLTAGRLAAGRPSGARTSDDDLLDAACRVFAADGYSGATMAAIAAAAGSTKPTLYAHFGDKDELYRRVLEREADACRDWLTAAYQRHAGLGLVEQTEADTTAFFDYAAARPDGFRLLLAGTALAGSSEIERSLQRAVTEQVARRVRDFAGADLDEAVVAQLAEMLVGVSVAAAQYATRAGVDLAEAGRFAARFNAEALAGLAGR